MSRIHMVYYSLVAVVSCVILYGLTLTARSAYESAEYTVLESDGPFETREYPDLLMATTGHQFKSQDDDGSFMRLFRYIRGRNDEKQKLAMTTPVFMEPETGGNPGQMGFVIPNSVSEERVPEPSADNVQIQRRKGGRFAVIRFTGRISHQSVTLAEKDLREWMSVQDLNGETRAEYAGYDPPWTPGPLRRNEVLIRLN